jgi:hypothetical protein
MVPVWYFAPRFIWQDWFSSSRMKQNFNCKERIIKSRVIKSICLVAKHCLLRCVAKRQPMSSFYVDGFVFFFFLGGGGCPFAKKNTFIIFHTIWSTSFPIFPPQIDFKLCHNHWSNTARSLQSAISLKVTRIGC